MLDISQMAARLILAIILGTVMGIERGLVGKEAGVRTSMLVASGAAMFAMIGLTLPYIVAGNNADIPNIISGGTFMNVIANVVVGIGFLGAGIIIKTQEHVHGLTTAAAMWATAAIGVLAGIGMTSFAVIATVLLSGLLYLLRKMDVAGILEKEHERDASR